MKKSQHSSWDFFIGEETSIRLISALNVILTPMPTTFHTESGLRLIHQSH